MFFPFKIGVECNNPKILNKIVWSKSDTTFFATLFLYHWQGLQLIKIIVVGLFAYIGLGYLLWYWAQIFWVSELRPVQLQLNLIRLVRKLCLIRQKRPYGRQNCFRWVVAGRYDNNKTKESTFDFLIKVKR